jgi:prolyl oligopeptidase
MCRRPHFLLAAPLLMLAACQTAIPLAPPPPATVAPVAAPADPYLYMEDADSSRALDWVREQNARTLDVLQKDPRYATLKADALAVLTATDRIPEVAFGHGDELRNFWQDKTHVRGIWRQTSLPSFRKAHPAWTTLLDVDALAFTEKADWVWEGAQCLPPANQRCLLKLSDGGKDANSLREFDASTKTFVTGGFVAPESKQDVEWYDANTLYIGRDWGPGTLTASGYPYIVKEWKRGTPLSAAREVFRGEKTDVSASATVLRDADGKPQAVIMEQATSFFEVRYFLLTDQGTTALPFPLKSQVRGLLDGQVILSLQQDFPAQSMRQGDLISFDLAALKANAATAKATLVLRPAENQAIDHMEFTRSRLLVALYEDVKGTLVSYAHGRGGWTRSAISVPPEVSVTIETAARSGDRAIVTTQSFLTPTQQWLVDTANGRKELLRSLPARFDASRDAVEQQWAVSADGTRIPYFVVRPKNLKLDGTAPTLLYAYGGFQISETPSYSGVIGKLWLERGGVFVLANIRGGGEFGPRWHQAGLKENRQRVFDDFTAVAKSLIERGITSPPHLGIMGGSNGGLLMGVAMTQHPELYNAIVIQVPLLDMLRYTQIGAGASWVGEYGDPAIPAERAYIEKYSPYQQLRAGMKYPEVFFETATHDDRVHPAHARKAAARLQELGYPFYYYENTEGGHSTEANLLDRAQDYALDFTYLSQKLMP